MAKAGWLLLKWLVIPVALACAGYYFVGPRITQIMPGDTAAKPPQAQPPASSTNTGSSDDSGSTDGKQSTYPAPDVTVSRGASHEGATPVKRHRRHRTEKPKPDTSSPVQVSPPDQGGSGGAATTGGSGGDGGGSGGGGGDAGGGGGTGGTDGK